MLLAAYTLALAAVSTDESCPAGAAGAAWTTGGSDDIVDWVTSKGGFFSPSLTIREGKLGRGVFATAPIKNGDALIGVPVELVIGRKVKHPCVAVEALRAELALGECSLSWPYLKSMNEVVADMPNAWSSEDLALLDGLPGNWTVHTERYRECPSMGSAPISDPFAMRALMLFASRSGPLGMQPIFDILNHGYNSTKHFEEKGQHIFYAARDHEAGEEVLNTFHSGAGAGRSILLQMAKHGASPGSAPELFINYGFLEPAPVMWKVGGGDGDDTLSFVIEDGADAENSVLPMALRDEWGRFVSGETLSDKGRAELARLAVAARGEIAKLDERSRTYRAGGLHCAAALLDPAPQAASVDAHGYAVEFEQPKRTPCGPRTPRQELALAYRSAYLAALNAAATAAQRLLDRDA